MKATKANLKRCGFGTIMYCTKCYSKLSADAKYYWDYEDDHVFECGICKTEMVLGRFAKIFIPASASVVCVIHDQEDWISTWLVEVPLDVDPLEAIHNELFEDDEDWPDLKESIEWFYLNQLAVQTLKDMKWPETYRDDQTFEYETVKAAVYRAFKVGGEEES